eukprot:Hpha_TRINITY_DN20403_c0_g1::TRINITY_DN20403_c0_g1_i1::g.64203::m.64203
MHVACPLQISDVLDALGQLPSHDPPKYPGRHSSHDDSKFPLQLGAPLGPTDGACVPTPVEGGKVGCHHGYGVGDEVGVVLGDGCAFWGDNVGLALGAGWLGRLGGGEAGDLVGWLSTVAPG